MWLSRGWDWCAFRGWQKAGKRKRYAQCYQDSNLLKWAEKSISVLEVFAFPYRSPVVNTTPRLATQNGNVSMILVINVCLWTLSMHNESRRLWYNEKQIIHALIRSLCDETNARAENLSRSRTMSLGNRCNTRSRGRFIHDWAGREYLTECSTVVEMRLYSQKSWKVVGCCWLAKSGISQLEFTEHHNSNHHLILVIN